MEKISADKAGGVLPGITGRDWALATFGLDPKASRSSLLPIVYDEAGAPSFGVPEAGVDILRALALPGYGAMGGQATADDALNYGMTLGGVGAARSLGKGPLPDPELGMFSSWHGTGSPPWTPTPDAPLGKFDRTKMGSGGGRAGVWPRLLLRAGAGLG